MSSSTSRIKIAAVQGPNGIELKQPKTDSSLRRVDLVPRAVAILEAHRKTQTGTNPLDLVFPGSNGQVYDRANVKRALYRTLDDAGLPRATFHSLRHAGNSLLAEAGISLKILQARLGHATSKITLDTYSHVSDDAGRRAADTLGGLLNGSKRAGRVRSNGLTLGLTRSKKARSAQPRVMKKA